MTREIAILLLGVAFLAFARVGFVAYVGLARRAARSRVTRDPAIFLDQHTGERLARLRALQDEQFETAAADPRRV